MEGITPDILMIWAVYITLREGQVEGMLWGFGIGLGFDLVTGTFIGLTALTKTIACFVAGYFYNENKIQMTLSSYRFIVIVLMTSFVHNTIYFFIFNQGSDIALLRSVVEIGVATTIYTSALTLLPMFIIAQKNRA